MYTWHNILSFDLFCISGICEDDAFPQASWTRSLRQQKGQELQKDRRQWSTQLFWVCWGQESKEIKAGFVFFCHEVRDLIPRRISKWHVHSKCHTTLSETTVVLRVLHVTLSADWSGKSPRVWSRDLWWHAMKLSSFGSDGSKCQKNQRKRRKQ